MLSLQLKPEFVPFTREKAEHFVMGVERFESGIFIEYENKVINAKSMLGLLSIGRVNGGVTVSIDGEDEREALKAVQTLLKIA